MMINTLELQKLGKSAKSVVSRDTKRRVGNKTPETHKEGDSLGSLDSDRNINPKPSLEVKE